MKGSESAACGVEGRVWRFAAFVNKALRLRVFWLTLVEMWGFTLCALLQVLALV